MESEIASSDLTIEQVSEKISRSEISPVLLTEEHLKRIDTSNPRLKLFITVLHERARVSARQSEERISSSRYLGRLDGVPIGIKDIIFIRGVRCTAGSKILSDFVPEYSSPVVQKLEESGAVILGTMNLHEFASGVTTVNPYYGTARNPWDEERITGGSSGGSAAAVAAALAFAALGTDTSGSVRIPSSLCGVVGLKATYGLVSMRGTIPLAQSFDHVGILARSCSDAALVLQCISGYDEEDRGSIKPPEKFDYFEEARQSVRGLKIGVPRKYFFDLLDDEVEDAFENAVKNLRSLGLVIEDVEIPGIEQVRDVWAAIRLSEASAYHKNWLETRPGDYGEDVRQMLERGTKFSAVEYIARRKQAAELRNNMIKVLETCSAFITPTTPIPAPRIGAKMVSIKGAEVDVYSVLSKLTLPFNVTGLPALSLPVGLSKEGLPLALQIAGGPFNEGKILGIGRAYEEKFGKETVLPFGH